MINFKTYVDRGVDGFGGFISFSIEVMVFNGIGEGVDIVFQGLFGVVSSFVVNDDFGLKNIIT